MNSGKCSPPWTQRARQGVRLASTGKTATLKAIAEEAKGGGE
ncbi:MAG: hypothetical protein ACYC6G_00085 [Desulfobaccales bacterium]